MSSAATPHPEKGPLLPAPQQQSTPQKQWTSKRLVQLIALLLLGCYWLGYAPLKLLPRGCRHHHLPNDGEVDMSSSHVGELIEHKCWKDTDENAFPHEMQCFRMAAPLDYTNPDDHRKANIALARYPAGGGKTPRDKVLGTVFLNPGGPGGSGIDFITRTSAKYNGSSAKFFDALFESRYDVMSFDPRGVQRTWPRADCFRDPLESYADDTFFNGAGLVHSSSGAAPKHLAHNQLLAGLCKNRLGELLPHVTTSAVVKDLNLMRKAVGDEKLNYAGFSYGTVLGSYFADIFPDRVGHFWLDGVVDVPNYQAGLWNDNLVDFEDVLSGFFTTCVAAGPKYCPLASSIPADLADDPKEAADFLAEAFHAQLDSLATTPVAVPKGDFPGLSTYIGYKSAYFSEMYSPSEWHTLANLSAAAQKGDWVPFLAAFGLQKYQAPLHGTKSSPEASFAIMCSDVPEPEKDWTLDDYLAHEAELEKTSPFGAEIWIRYWSMCRGAWKIRGADIWEGSFDSKPANPILFGSNRFDPVTPLRAARKMQKSFAGPNKLFQVEDGYGHCTIASTSRCAQKIVANYFVRDEMPEEDETLCKVEAPPFKPQPSPIPPHELSSLSVQDRVQVEALQGFRGVADVWAQWRRSNALPL